MSSGRTAGLVCTCSRSPPLSLVYSIYHIPEEAGEDVSIFRRFGEGEGWVGLVTKKCRIAKEAMQQQRTRVASAGRRACIRGYAPRANGIGAVKSQGFGR